MSDNEITYLNCFYNLFCEQVACLVKCVIHIYIVKFHACVFSFVAYLKFQALTRTKLSSFLSLDCIKVHKLQFLFYFNQASA